MASEKLQLLQQQHSPRTLSAAVAGALESGGGGSGRGSKLRVRCYDEDDLSVRTLHFFFVVWSVLKVVL